MRTLRLIVLTALIASVTSAEGAPSGSYRLNPGPHEVRVIEDLALRDAARSKDLRCTLRVPEGADDPVPLVVFSHGAGGDQRAFAELSAHWASWGYAVVHPTHSDSVRLRKEQGEDITDLRNKMRNIVSKVDLPDRVADVRFLLDSIPELEQRGGVEIDRDRIAMAGHSAGAMTTQIVSGVKVRASRRFGGDGTFLSVSSAADPRITCAIVISGQGSSRLFAADSWSDLDLPMLVITGSRDTTPVSDETPESRRMPFDLAKPSDKYLLYIEGATHSSYQGRRSAAVRAALDEEEAEDIEMVADATAITTTAFLDAYLRADREAKAYLASDRLERFTGERAVLSNK